MSARTDSEAETVQKSTGVTPEGLKIKLEKVLGATHVQIEDMSGGCGQMFEAIIVSPQFAKKTTLARHRLVNNTLKEEIAAIHAWTPKCHTPEEWEKKKAQS
ncbi:bola-like protein [Zopfia rhizophila CBS 207.26]|uniref:Bola-like protein n=1 Tax=Zopfia rhizophila CBS 207.26 TaxID=1314779 RepID=A0A6A6EVK4_9PEZI|nr:bola-like protein [Zopfia rhizophila CBS 207.26]